MLSTGATKLNEQVPSEHRTKSFLFFLLKVLLGCGIVFFLLIKLDFSKVVHAFQKANYGYLCLGMIGIICQRILLAWQTSTAIRHYDIVLSTKRAFIINQIVNFYSLFLPSGITGGVIKWYRFSQHSGKRAETLAAIIIIKIYYLTFMLAAGTLALVFENPFGKKIMYFTLLAIFLAIVFVMFIFYAESLIKITYVFNYSLRRLPDWLSRRLYKLCNELNYFKQFALLQLFYFLVVPPLVLCCVTLVYYLTALGLGLKIPLFSAIWISAMIVLIQHVPAFISGLGLREGALILLLPIYEVTLPQAMAFSLISFGYVLAMGLLGGLFEVNEQFLKKSHFPKKKLSSHANTKSSQNST
jgi:uncharacterized membrane protein YbhN (UPF0104 family)